MLSDGTWTYTWEHGRELATMSNGSTTWTNTYNADGLRTKRTNGSTTYNYIYNGSSQSQMTVGNNTLYFAYDASGTPMSVTYNGTNYYYATNVQGDVTAILNSSGTAVVQYTYDAWGKILTTTGSMASTLGAHNPLRYRGYVYDTETTLYYLQSRYYDPEMGRFINGDALASTGQGVLGNNMFAYCQNNPVSGYDPTGFVDWGGVLVGIGILGIGALALSAALLLAPTAGPLVGAVLSTVGLAAGAGAVETGAVVTVGAVMETPIVIDTTVTDGSTHNRRGYSFVVDFEDDLIDVYYHHGVTTSGSSSFSYGVGFVQNYENVGDYGGHFVDAGGSVSAHGVDFGFDVCTDPTRVGKGGATAELLTVGFSFPAVGRSGPIALGYDYYLPVSVMSW